MTARAETPDVAPDVAKVRVWDAPVRIIHWMLAVCVVFSWLTAEVEQLALHHLSGYLIFALLATRIAWGFVGSTTARFAHFLKGPAAVRAYAARMFARDHAADVGHNPLGALSVTVLLGLLVLQVMLGLFAQDSDGLGPGPLAAHISRQTGRAVAEIHEAVFSLLLIFIVLHIVAVLFHLCYKHDNLIVPMLTGRKQLPLNAATGLRFVHGKWALLTFLAALGAVVLLAAI